MSEEEKKLLKKKKEEEEKNEKRKQINVDQVWKKVHKTFEAIKKVNLEPDTSPGWKTVRIFVSSTFKDFHSEREVLVKEIFSDLRGWCEQRCLHLVDCDLRWGVPRETPEEDTLKTCLEEINRCREDNGMPYFLNMTSERIGWIPLEAEIKKETIEHYHLIIGLSVTEMEIMHAAYRQDNPNAMFLIRDDSYLDTIEDGKVKQEFVDNLQPIAKEKLVKLKREIGERFENVWNYKCSYVPGDKLSTGRPKLRLQPDFNEQVLNFFKSRIEEQYPVVEKIGYDEFEVEKNQHKSFMMDRGESVFGREELINEILAFVESGDEDQPMLILGEPGAGKSAVMANAASKMANKVKTDLFYHFVGGTPGSTDLLAMLRRLNHDLRQTDDFQTSGDMLESPVFEVRSALSGCDDSRRIILYIDALNQLDIEPDTELYAWLPDKLPPNVRCVMSMINNSPAHQQLKGRGTETLLEELEEKEKMINDYLNKFNKKLDDIQLKELLSKQSSNNPLWLRTACEELRVFGDFNKVLTKIEGLPDLLNDLLSSVLQRFEDDMGEDRKFLKATLCLLEMSKHGLLEDELLQILAGIHKRDAGIDDETFDRLPSARWASVYRNLRPYLRPFGSASEGRLQFYHQSLSTVVRGKYLGFARDAEPDPASINPNYIPNCIGWHTILADYYENKSSNYDRKVEEYPHQLKKLERREKLETFLLDWNALERLFDENFSDKLVKYWRFVKPEFDDSQVYRYMKDRYSEKLQEQRSSSQSDQKSLIRHRDCLFTVSKLFLQAGLYEDATTLATECLDLVNKELEKTNDPNVEKVDLQSKEKALIQLMHLYGHLAEIETTRIKKDVRQKLSDSKLYKRIMANHQKAVEIIETRLSTSDRDVERFKALQLVKIGFCLGQLADRCTFLCSRKQTKYRQEGLQNLTRGIEIYSKINANGQLIEAYITKATLLLHMNERHEALGEAMNRCKQIYGSKHLFTARINYNEGIAYEKEGKYREAYECFKTSYLIGKEIFGPKHDRTKKYIRTLNEFRYKKMAKKEDFVV